MSRLAALKQQARIQAVIQRSYREVVPVGSQIEPVERAALCVEHGVEIGRSSAYRVYKDEACLFRRLVSLRDEKAKIRASEELVDFLSVLIWGTASIE